MIEVIGEPGTREYEAACQMRDRIRSAWGRSIEEPLQKISLLTQVQLTRQNVNDIDVLLLLRLREPQVVTVPFAAVRNLPLQVYVKSLCVCLEVKDHSPSGVDITDSGWVRVKYPGHWHDASKQNRDQVHALRNYLDQVGITVPFVAGAVWLRGYPQAEMPEGVRKVLAAEATWPDAVGAILEHQRTFFRDGFHYLEGENEPGSLTRIRHHFAEPIKPSTLDRRKLEAIAKAGIQAVIDNAVPGEHQLVFRGRGGTGKTIALLHLAYDRYVRFWQRSLFLTYNVALAAEIERLLRILSVRERVGDSSIRVETMLGFLARVASRGGLIPEGVDFLEQLKHIKASLLEHLADTTWLQLIREESDLLAWDLVCIDEAQDSPEDERDILHRLFGPQLCLVADGIDQMVRLTQSCNWMPGAIKGQSRTRFLVKSHRLELNLVRFVNAVAVALGLEGWQLGENADLPGGRVILTFDPDPRGGELFAALSQNNKEIGNDPIDMLFCVPSMLVNSDSTDLIRCIPARRLSSRGLEVWDGTHAKGRERPLVSNQLHRFVQYESCRGLEGWITFLLGLDRFHEQKQSWYRAMRSDLSQGEVEKQAQIHADEWLMIPLTRCISTLVIQLASPDSSLSKILLHVADGHRDYVEIQDWGNGAAF
jgi:hypothetical protein